MTPQRLSILLLTLPLLGCKTTIDLDYAFALEQSGSASDLTFEDERFAFAFEVVPSGVWFQVHNLTDAAAYIDWSNTFFVIPSGNVFNALNTDIINESNEVAARSLNRTQVPTGAVVSRFTTATVNAKESNLVLATEVGSMLSTTNVTWSTSTGYTWRPDESARSSASYARALVTSEVEYWSARQFWPGSLTVSPGRELEALQRLSQGIETERPIALGIRLAFGNDFRDYRFDFPIAAIFASQIKSVPDDSVPAPAPSKVSTAGEPGTARVKTKSKRVLIYTLTPSAGWSWQAPLDASSTDLQPKIDEDAPLDDVLPLVGQEGAASR
jgi:hypothetical protein